MIHKKSARNQNINPKRMAWAITTNWLPTMLKAAAMVKKPGPRR